MVIEDQGTVVLFTPEGDYEHEWLALNVESEPWQWLGKSLVVDHRMAQGLVEMVEDNGFVVERKS
jgi:hypothetical protein